ncbi:MAG: transglutaminase domain-containing protein [Crocinitomicaceae bacterium]
MKRITPLIFLAISFQTFGQDYPNLTKLAEQLISESRRDSLNLASIFNWITDNIEYDTKTYFEDLDYPEFGIDPYLDSAHYMKIYNQEVSEMVITNRKAICGGYSRLFLTLCELAGIKCHYITGKVKFPLRDELGEHAWNAAYIDGEWKLLDLTWASGGLSGKDFIKEKNMFFYFTPPEQLIYDHYPDEQRWSLLDSTKMNNILSESPILSHQPFKSGLVEYFPMEKTFEIDTLKPFKLTFEFNRAIKPYDISISGWPSETLRDKLKIEVTNDNYDSLENIYPRLSYVIPKIEIIEQKTIGNRLEFTILPLTSSLEKIYVYIESMWPSMIYDVKFKL